MYDCSLCYSSTQPPAATRVAKLGAAIDAGLPIRADDEHGFSYGPVAFERLSKKSLLVAMVVKNLARDCKTGVPIRIPAVKEAPFGGMAGFEVGPFKGIGPLKYEGKMTVRDKILYLDMQLRPEFNSKLGYRVHAEASEDGDLISYSELAVSP